MTVEYDSTKDLVTNICKAYLRPLYNSDDIDYNECNKDMAAYLLTDLECLVFFVKNPYNSKPDTHYLCYFYSDKTEGFKYDPTYRGPNCGVLGYISKTSDNPPKYTFINTGNRDLNVLIDYEYQFATDDSGNTLDNHSYNFDFYEGSLGLFQAKFSFYYLKDSDSFYGIDTYITNTKLTLLDPSIAFNDADLDNGKYFYDQYKLEKTKTVVCNNTLYGMKPNAETFPQLFESIGNDIPLSNVVDADRFSAIIDIVISQNYVCPVYITINGKDTSDVVVDLDDDKNNDNVITWSGTMTTYGCPLSQEVKLTYNLTVNKIRFTPVNGALNTDWYSYEIYALFIDPPKTMVETTVMNLLYPVKTLVDGTSYMYMADASHRMRSINDRYQQMNHLYVDDSGTETITNNGVGKGVWADSITGDGKGPNDCNVLYRFFDTLSYNYIASGTTITTSNILESDITQTIESKQYTDVNIRYKTNEYGLLPSDTTDITTPTDRTYITPATSDLLFNGETAVDRYRDLSYFKGITTGINGAISVKDGDSGYLCTLVSRDIFVSRCYSEPKKIPADSNNSITKPVIFGGNTLYKEQGYTLLSYASSCLPSGATKGYATPLTDSSNFTTIITKDSYDRIIYVEIVLRNVDIDKETGTVYFDTLAEANQLGTKNYIGKPFYGYLIIDGTDSSGIKVTFYYNNLSKSITLTVDSEASNFRAEDSTSKFAIELTGSTINVTNYQELLPANMMFKSNSLDDDNLTTINELNNDDSTLPSYKIMAVYVPENEGPSRPDEIESSICLYSNKIYLEEGEYELTGYSTGLYNIINATNKTQLEAVGNLDWLGYSRLYIVYTVTESTNTFKNRLFVICYHLSSTTKHVIQLTFYKFSNKVNAVLEECQNVIVDMTPVTSYTDSTGQQSDDFPTLVGDTTIATSSCTFDVTLKYDSSKSTKYTMDYINYWYNYLPKTTGNVIASIVSIIGVVDR